MDPITLDTDPDGGHSADRTRAVADVLAEAVRALNYASRPENAPDALPYPSTLYDVVGRLQAAAAGMDQLTSQLAGRLTEIAAHERLRVTHGAHQGDPAGAAGEALDALETVRKSAAELDGALRSAHGALSPLGVVLDDADEGDGDA